MSVPEVRISLSKEELEGFCLMCDKQLDGLNRSIRYLEEDDTSYNSFERIKLEARRQAWKDTHQKVINALEVITTVNGNYEEPEHGEAKVIYDIARADG